MKQNSLSCDVKIVLSRSCASITPCQQPLFATIVAETVTCSKKSIHSSLRGIGKKFVLVSALCVW